MSSTGAAAAGRRSRQGKEQDQGRQAHEGLSPRSARELGLLIRSAIGDLQFEKAGADALVEHEGRGALEVTLRRPDAGEAGDQFVLATPQIAEVQAVHTAAEQRVDSRSV